MHISEQELLEALIKRDMKLNIKRWCFGTSNPTTPLAAAAKDLFFIDAYGQVCPEVYDMSVPMDARRYQIP